jgi:oligopeptide/dipeptide ABC transporter ATP-binding protein
MRAHIAMTVLEISDLVVDFDTDDGVVEAIDHLALTVREGEILGLVGESGCGKSTLGKTILGIYHPSTGEVRFQGRVISGLPTAEARHVRREIQYIYQDPGASLDPWWTVGRSLREPLHVHTRLSRAEIQARVEAVLTAVGLEPSHLRRYPHEFSGGQQRRLALARILVLNPSLIIFDEPTAGLDVSVQATILRFFRKLKDEFKLTYIFISHDLSIIRLMCQRVAVMYLGVIVETGPTEAIFQSPKHPYTQALLAAVRRPEVGPWEGVLLQGEPPRSDDVPSGCRFRLRCPYAQPNPCARLEPRLEDIEPGHAVACHLAHHELPDRPSSNLNEENLE